MKTKVPVTNPDGQTVIATLTWPTNHGMLACQLVTAIITSDAVRAMTQDDAIPYPLHCKKMAVIACDLAEAMYQEMEDRDWLIQLPEPT